MKYKKQLKFEGSFSQYDINRFYIDAKVFEEVTINIRQTGRIVTIEMESDDFEELASLCFYIGHTLAQIESGY